MTADEKKRRAAEAATAQVDMARASADQAETDFHRFESINDDLRINQYIEVMFFQY